MHSHTHPERSIASPTVDTRGARIQGIVVGPMRVIYRHELNSSKLQH